MLSGICELVSFGLLIVWLALCVFALSDWVERWRHPPTPLTDADLPGHYEARAATEPAPFLPVGWYRNPRLLLLAAFVSVLAVVFLPITLIFAADRLRAWWRSRRHANHEAN